MAGHILRDSISRWITKRKEHSNLVLSEFHHIVGTAFLMPSYMIFYFSGTGNSKWVAEQLSKQQEEKLVFIPEAIQAGLNEFEVGEDEKVGFVFPIYSWGPPSIVLNFINKLVLHKYHTQYVFFVCSCGDDTGLTEQVVCKALKSRSIICNAGFSVIMPNNYVLLPGFDVDSKELEQKKLADAVQTMDEINRQITERRNLSQCNEGGFAWLKSKVINPWFERGITAKPFHATESCIGCGLCEKSCPVENITIVNKRPVWKENCTSCLACYHVCPRRAVQYGKRTKKKGQYFNPNSSPVK